MGIIKYKPTSPGRRFQSVSDFAEITSAEPVKSLLKPLKRTGGRNCHGRITARFIGGGHKRKISCNRFLPQQGRYSRQGCRN